MFAHQGGDRWQLGDLVAPGRGCVDLLGLAEAIRAGLAALRPMINDRVHPLERGGAVGGSWEGGSEELRECRLRRSSSSTRRASSRRFASISSPTRMRRASAVSRSWSSIASASARSMVPSSPSSGGSLLSKREGCSSSPLGYRSSVTSAAKGR